MCSNQNIYLFESKSVKFAFVYSTLTLQVKEFHVVELLHIEFVQHAQDTIYSHRHSILPTIPFMRAYNSFPFSVYARSQKNRIQLREACTPESGMKKMRMIQVKINK